MQESGHDTNVIASRHHYDKNVIVVGMGVAAESSQSLGLSRQVSRHYLCRCWLSICKNRSSTGNRHKKVWTDNPNVLMMYMSVRRPNQTGLRPCMSVNGARYAKREEKQMSRKQEHEERATHHVHLWLANNYDMYMQVQSMLKDARKQGHTKAMSVHKIARQIARDFIGMKADGFRFTQSRVAAYVATEWDEADLYEANSAPKASA